jgi:hypothetical protein
VREREDANRTRETGNRDEVEGAVAITLNSFRHEAIDFIDWLDLSDDNHTIMRCRGAAALRLFPFKRPASGGNASEGSLNSLRYRLWSCPSRCGAYYAPGGNQALQKTPRVTRIMRIYITPCSAKKDEKYQASGELVPPNLLYTSKKTQGFMRQCKVRQVAWAIFSDLYGVWFPEIRHAWYEKDPNSVTDEEFWQLLRNFDESLAPYSQICFYHNPGSLNRLHERLLKETALADRVKMITKLRDIA